jgi:hypothetical protein
MPSCICRSYSRNQEAGIRIQGWARQEASGREESGGRSQEASGGRRKSGGRGIRRQGNQEAGTATTAHIREREICAVENRSDGFIQ